jgi:hypothetical protein
MLRLNVAFQLVALMAPSRVAGGFAEDEGVSKTSPT